MHFGTLCYKDEVSRIPIVCDVMRQGEMFAGENAWECDESSLLGVRKYSPPLTPHRRSEKCLLLKGTIERHKLLFEL